VNPIYFTIESPRQATVLCLHAQAVRFLQADGSWLNSPISG
jgi:hypothetical protein